MSDDRRHDDEYVTRGELRQLERRLSIEWRKVREALEFYDAMCELGLRELLPVLLRSERTRQVVAGLREGRYRWGLQAVALLGGLSLLTGTVGGAIAILRTVGLIK